MPGRTMRCLVVAASQHHGNTEKVARAMAEALGAEVRQPRDVDPEALREYDLVGFGSGIDSDRHYPALLGLADALPMARRKMAFIFSTCGAPAIMAGEEYLRKYAEKSHAALRGKLVSRGYVIMGEYNCPGFNTNSFLRYFGGLNKGRPDARDLDGAGEFARGLKGELARSRETEGA
jgi:flavodoxin